MNSKPALPPLPSQNLAADFFSGPGPVHIEARGEGGEHAPVDRRRVTQALAGAKRWMAGAMIGMVALGAAGSASADLGQVDTNFSESHVMQLVDYGAGSNIKVNVTTEDKMRAGGPAAHIEKDKDGSNICHISLHNIDIAAWQMAGNLEEKNAAQMKEFIIIHEASHCEYFNHQIKQKSTNTGGMFGIFFQKDESIDPNANSKIGNGSITVGDKQAFLDQLDDVFMKKVETKSIGGGPLYYIMSEMYADTKTSLIIAQKTIGQAKSAEDVKAGLEKFNSYLNDIKSFRSKHSQDDPLHDTSDLLSRVQHHINEKASSPDGLKYLQEQVLTDDAILSKTLKWSAGNLITNSGDIQKYTIELIVDSLPGLIDSLDDQARMNSKLSDAKKSIPQLERVLDSGKNLYFSEEDFSGRARKLAEDGLREHDELPKPADYLGLKSKTSQALDDLLQDKLQSPQAMSARFMGSFMLGAKKPFDEHDRAHPGAKLRL